MNDKKIEEKAKRLLKIKNEFAVNSGYEDWIDYLDTGTSNAYYSPDQVVTCVAYAYSDSLETILTQYKEALRVLVELTDKLKLQTRQMILLSLRVSYQKQLLKQRIYLKTNDNITIEMVIANIIKSAFSIEIAFCLSLPNKIPHINKIACKRRSRSNSAINPM